MLRSQKLCRNKIQQWQSAHKYAWCTEQPGLPQLAPGDAPSVSLGLAALPIDERLLLLFSEGLPILSVFLAAVQQGQTVL